MLEDPTRSAKELEVRKKPASRPDTVVREGWKKEMDKIYREGNKGQRIAPRQRRERPVLRWANRSFSLTDPFLVQTMVVHLGPQDSHGTEKRSHRSSGWTKRLKHHEFGPALRGHPAKVLAVERAQFVGSSFLCRENVQGVVDSPTLQTKIRHALKDGEVFGASKTDDLFGPLRNVLFN
jgi:hypothetical protein